MIDAYTPVGWVNDSPPYTNAANFNKMDDAILAAINELRRLAGDPAAPNTAIALDALLRVGTLTFLGPDTGNVAALNYLIGYIGSGIYYDGANWQAPGDGTRNGWACIGFHADGTAYIYQDASTGAAPRTYTKAQFLAKRVASIAAAPSGLSQEGAAAKDFIGWDDVLGKYAPRQVLPSDLAAEGASTDDAMIYDGSGWVPSAIAQPLVELYDSGEIAAAVASFDVSGISQAYRHLRLLFFGRTTAGSANFVVRVNGDTTAGNYSAERIGAGGAAVGSASEASSLTGTAMGLRGSSAAAGAASALIVELPFYTSTAWQKLSFAWDANHETAQHLATGEWKNTAAINRVTVSPSSGNWEVGSRLVIYGVA